MIKKSVNTYQYGNTVRFECDFFDFSGEKIDPQIVKLIVYNYKYQAVHTAILNTNNRQNIGEYYFDYTTELKEQKLYYEWYGEIDGKPSLKRGEFITRFI